MKCRKSDLDSINKASEILKKGNVTILPTDTVYGFSGIIGKTDEKIRKIKGRSETKPFIVLISKPEELKNLSNDEIPPQLLKFWPGPLTVIVRDKDDFTKTIAVRCPGDEWLRKVIEETGNPIYSTSVNRSGSPVLTKENEILKEFEDEVSLVVLNGDSVSSVPSTIVKLEDDGFTVIREGACKV